MENIYWVWLTLVNGIGAKRYNSLINNIGSPKNIYDLSNDEIMGFSRIIGTKQCKSIIANRNTKTLDIAQKICENKNIRIVTIKSGEYPFLLKNIFDPPPVLYIKGQQIPNIPMIAVVGSRRCTAYGREVAKKLSYELCEAGVGVVSGLARGIDTMAHYGALSAYGYTVSVLGSGIDVIYPPENRKLYNKILEMGTIVSEYPPGQKPNAGNFPARNRIVSGLSNGVLVVEAAKKSGALITVDFALDQGREVFVVPGNINNTKSVGTNNLIKDGAITVTNINDILDNLNIKKISKKEKIKEHQLDIFELQVYNALDDGEKSIDELLNKTNMSIIKLNSILTMLEIKGIIKQLPGGVFVKLDF